VQAGISVPLWFGKNKGRVARARANMKKAEAARVALTNDTRTQIRTIYFKLENAKRLRELYDKELLPQAAKAMEIAETWFREGEATFSDFIEAQSVWYNFQLALSRAEADYGKFFSHLERLAGQRLSEKTPPQNEKLENNIGKEEK
jgi:outer membrane protein TolC